MSARLRDAARELLRELAEEVEIVPDSLVGKLQAALEHADRRLIDIEPSVVSDRDARIAALLHALGQFRKVNGGHFVGCPGDKGARCSVACTVAQAAVEPRTQAIGRSTAEALRAELDAAIKENRRTAAQLRHERGYFRRVLRVVKAETGFEMRKPGRPKKSDGDVRSDVAAGNTGCPGL